MLYAERVAAAADDRHRGGRGDEERVVAVVIAFVLLLVDFSRRFVPIFFRSNYMSAFSRV